MQKGLAFRSSRIEIVTRMTRRRKSTENVSLDEEKFDLKKNILKLKKILIKY